MTTLDFMAAILANPDDDAPRLIYADWLEEQGDSDRSEFIKVQCELAKDKRTYRQWADGKEFVDQSIEELTKRVEEYRQEKWPNTYSVSAIKVVPNLEEDELRRRERELLDGNEQKWFKLPFNWIVSRGPVVPNPHHGVVIPKRGFIAEVHTTLQEWMGQPCSCYRQTGILRNPFDGHFTCKKCKGRGTLPGHGPAIVRAAPVEKVVITDAVIHPSNGNNTYYVGGLDSYPVEYWSRLENLPSRQAALAALSDALLLHAKSLPYSPG